MGGNYISLQSLVNFSRSPIPRVVRTRLFGLIDTQKYVKQGTAAPGPLPLIAASMLISSSSGKELREPTYCFRLGWNPG
jgi:hypothetical protein